MEDVFATYRIDPETCLKDNKFNFYFYLFTVKDTKLVLFNNEYEIAGSVKADTTKLRKSCIKYMVNFCTQYDFRLIRVFHSDLTSEEIVKVPRIK